MKKLFLPVAMLVLFSFTTNDGPLTKAERKFATEHLKNTKKQLLNAVKGLSTEQLNFKATPESWSIAECTEHIAISENMLFGMFDGVLKTTPDPAKRSDVKMTDEQVIAMITDRSNKIKTQEPFKPTGKFGSHEGTVKEFVTKRDEHIKSVKKIQDDLRNRYQQLPFGIIDGYQVLLFISAHTERHIKQIEEVKANTNFPKN
jgi:hypothetical protein